MEDNKKNTSLLSCRTCSVDVSNAKEKKGIKKWIPNFCIGHIAFIAGLVYLLVMQIMN